MPFKSRLMLLGAAAALSTSLSLPAIAQDAKPEPTSCAGVTLTDPAGDQALQRPTSSAPGIGSAPQNLDVLRAFFRYVPSASGDNVLTANIEVTKLDKSLAQGSSSSAWYMRWSLGDVLQFVSATVGADGKVLYEWGHLEGTSIVADGTTTGRFLEGEKGIVEIVVPVAKMKLADKKLTLTFAQGRYVSQAAPDTPSLVSTADRGPDTGNGKDFSVTPCAEAGTPTPVQPNNPGATPPTSTPPPSGDPQSQPQQPSGKPAPAPAPAGPATLDLKVVAGKLIAKKVKKAKRFAVGLQAGERITGLSAKLRRGRTVVGSGNLASVGPGKGRLTVKIAKKALKRFKKGTYTLAFTGKKADGRTATGSVALRIR